MVLFASLLAGLALAASAHDAAGPPTQARLWSTYVDGVHGGFVSDERPELAREPSPEDLGRLPRDLPSLAVAFNCAADLSGRLRDCRPLYVATGGPALPRGADAAKTLTGIVS